MKLHLGCGKRNIEGYKHVDLATFPHIDVFTSVDDLSMFNDNTATEIYASHVLEYFDRFDAIKVLAEWRRVLIDGGTLRLSLPNFDNLLKIYNKSDDLNAILGPIFGRMQMNDVTIYHKTVYNRELLTSVLQEAGFGKEILDWDTFQIFPDHDDHSKAFFPHMDFSGIQVSLNVETTK
ncbi:hypothetical protein N8Z37_01275 [Octadecabacter sp.]|nr:hypothetical protein [Octadecabacter sp.]